MKDPLFIDDVETNADNMQFFTDATPEGFGVNYGPVVRKPFFGVSDKTGLKPVSSATETS